MDDSDKWPARLNAPQRNNFFFGKMMGVAQFEREQRYDIGQRWLINRLTVGTGVLCGLEVSLTADGKRLRVAPGVAVDPWGREIVVTYARDYDPFAAGGGCDCGDSTPPITEAKDYTLCLTYRECTTNDQPVLYADDCPGQPECQPDTIVATYGLALSAVEIPKPLDCGAWTAAVPAPAGTPGELIEVGDPGGRGGLTPHTPPIGAFTGTPVHPAAAAALSPPSVDVLRARLAAQLGAACGPPATTCVPLALVTAKRTDDAWSLTIADGPRRRIYTQAQMLEMILCLAKCCGSDHAGVDTPPPATTFQVTGVDVGTLSIAGGVAVLDPVPPTTAADRPQFAVLPAVGAAARGPVVIRITFNGKLAKDSVVLPTAPAAVPSVWLTRTDTTTPPAREVSVALPLAMVPDSLTAESSTLLLIVGGPAGAAAGMETRMLLTSAGGGVVDPGDYTLSLFGTDDAGHAPIKSDGSAAPAQILDGEYTGRFPSGDARPEGDFVFQFTLSRQTP